MNAHEARPDPVAARFQPNPELIARVHNDLLEKESERERFLRQQWETAVGALHVAVDALRKVWPVDNDLLPTDQAELLQRALRGTEDAYRDLGSLEESIRGTAYVLVGDGVITTHEALDEFEVRG